MTSIGTINLVNGGLDVTSIVDNLVTAAQTPITNLQTQTTSYQNKISAYQTLNSNMLALQTSVESLLFNGETAPLSMPSDFSSRFNTSIFALRTATSSNQSVVTATADKGMATGNYSISISQLAKFDSYASNNFSSDTGQTTQTGELVIQKGSDAGNAVHVTIDSTNNTLEGIKDAINEKNAGFTASVVNDGSSSPYRLVITSDDSGLANALKITNNLTVGTGSSLSLSVATAAQDAKLTVNNIDITSSSNAVTNAVEGMTFNLNAESGDAVVTVNRDVDSIVAGVKDFISKYNDFTSYVTSQSAYDSTTKSAGLLSGDPTIRDAQNQVATAVTQNVTSNGSAFSTLSQAGISMANDGTLSLDETKLRNALSTNFSDTARLFLADGTDDDGNTTSLLPALETRLKNFTDSLDGPITNATGALQTDITSINNEIKQMQARLDIQQQLWIAEYTQANQALQQLTVMQASITSQLSSLSSS
jgi:flagellar hook-associated protein 2